MECENVFTSRRPGEKQDRIRTQNITKAPNGADKPSVLKGSEFTQNRLSPFAQLLRYALFVMQYENLEHGGSKAEACGSLTDILRTYRGHMLGILRIYCGSGSKL